jgi:hypothetical protein
MAPNPRDPEIHVVARREERQVTVATGPSTIPDGLLVRTTILRGACVRSALLDDRSNWGCSPFHGINCTPQDEKKPAPRKGTSGFDKFFKKNIRR